MSDIALQWAVALGVGAVVAELVRSFLQRRKMGADAAKTITEAATQLLGPLQARVHELEAEIVRTRQELAEARTEVQALRLQVQASSRQLHHDGDPPPM